MLKTFGPQHCVLNVYCFIYFSKLLVKLLSDSVHCQKYPNKAVPSIMIFIYIFQLFDDQYIPKLMFLLFFRHKKPCAIKMSSFESFKQMDYD